MKISTLILDAHGVVVTKPLYFSQKLSEENNIPIEEIVDFFINEFPPCLTGEADLKEIIIPYLEKWNWKGTVDDLLKYWFEAENYVDERMIKYVKNLKEKGVKCYIATNQEKYRTDFMKKEMGLGSIFDEVFSSAYLKLKKPDTQFFAKLLEEIGVTDKNSVFFWDDSLRNIEGAKAFGINAEFYPSFEYFEKKMSECL